MGDRAYPALGMFRAARVVAADRAREKVNGVEIEVTR